MRRTRAGVTAVLGALLLAALADPAAAGASGSTSEDLIWGLNKWLLYLAVPITVLVEGILLYTVWKFRSNEEPLPTRENRRLEIVWTVATAIVLVAVGVGSYTVMASPYVTGNDQALGDGEDPIEVKVTAQRYVWTFEYPNETVGDYTGNATAVTSSGTLVLPEGRAVHLNVTSTDWLHSFHVPDLGLKQDAFPGQWTTITTKPTATGTYQLYCAEYCGSGHAQMLGTVEVRSGADFESWLAEQGS